MSKDLRQQLDLSMIMLTQMSSGEISNKGTEVLKGIKKTQNELTIDGFSSIPGPQLYVCGLTQISVSASWQTVRTLISILFVQPETWLIWKCEHKRQSNHRAHQQNYSAVKCTCQPGETFDKKNAPVGPLTSTLERRLWDILCYVISTSTTHMHTYCFEWAEGIVYSYNEKQHMTLKPSQLQSTILKPFLPFNNHSTITPHAYIGMWVAITTYVAHS